MRKRRWLEYLNDFQCIIEYTVGKTNVVTDALSRKHTGVLKATGEPTRIEVLSLTQLA